MDNQVKELYKTVLSQHTRVTKVQASTISFNVHVKIEFVVLWEGEGLFEDNVETIILDPHCYKE